MGPAASPSGWRARSSGCGSRSCRPGSRWRCSRRISCRRSSTPKPPSSATSSPTPPNRSRSKKGRSRRSGCRCLSRTIVVAADPHGFSTRQSSAATSYIASVDRAGGQSTLRAVPLVNAPGVLDAKRPGTALVVYLYIDPSLSEAHSIEAADEFAGGLEAGDRRAAGRRHRRRARQCLRNRPRQRIHPLGRAGDGAPGRRDPRLLLPLGRGPGPGARQRRARLPARRPRARLDGRTIRARNPEGGRARRHRPALRDDHRLRRLLRLRLSAQAARRRALAPGGDRGDGGAAAGDPHRRPDDRRRHPDPAAVRRPLPLGLRPGHGRLGGDRRRGGGHLRSRGPGDLRPRAALALEAGRAGSQGRRGRPRRRRAGPHRRLRRRPSAGRHPRLPADVRGGGERPARHGPRQSADPRAPRLELAETGIRRGGAQLRPGRPRPDDARARRTGHRVAAGRARRAAIAARAAPRVSPARSARATNRRRVATASSSPPTATPRASSSSSTATPTGPKRAKPSRGSKKNCPGCSKRAGSAKPKSG